MPTALRRRGSALQCPLPSAQNNSTAGRTQCSIVHRTKQCKCSARHQAVQHHTNSTDGAARHAGCRGPMRPCVTARRRRQGSVGQARKCTGPAMQQHTYTQRAHNTHSPARLPVAVGRHPGLCLLVIAPSAHHTTPLHTTPHHTTPHHTIPHHTTRHDMTPLHTSRDHNRPQSCTALHHTHASCKQMVFIVCQLDDKIPVPNKEKNTL